MKKFYLVLAALILQGTVNATSWRVCSKTEAGANFTSVADAVASNLVFAGDTLYIEPGHVEKGGTLHISKSLTIIGAGYFLVDNNINAMNIEPSLFSNSETYLNAEGTNVYGCTFVHTLKVNSNTHVIAGNLLNDGLWLNNSCENTIQNNMIKTFLYPYGTVESNTIENNIIQGQIRSDGASWSNCVFRNNTVIDAVENNYVARNFSNSNIYNNIIINTHQGFRTTTNSETQTVDTTWYSTMALDASASRGNNVQNNVLSCNPNAEFHNCLFNKGVEDVLIWNNANNFEEKYKHIANGPAVGAGVNGTTCGAYGHVNGVRVYTPAGIPQYRPYIYDANIDDTPNANNSINASFKIKVQQ